MRIQLREDHQRTVQPFSKPSQKKSLHNTSIRGYRHNLIINQLILVGVIQCIGYLSLSVAIFFFGGNLIGPGGLVAIGTLIVTIFC